MIRVTGAALLVPAMLLAATVCPAADEQAPRATLTGHTGDVFGVAFSPDGKQLVSGSTDKTVKVWNVETGKPVTTLDGHTFSVRSVAFNPDGKLVASSGHDGAVKVWDPAKK